MNISMPAMPSAWLRRKLRQVNEGRCGRRSIVIRHAQVLEIAYHLLKEPIIYRELGTDYFDRYCGRTTKAPQSRSTPMPRLPGRSHRSPNSDELFQDRHSTLRFRLQGTWIWRLACCGDESPAGPIVATKL
jgi:hypothetical protein